MGENEKGKYRGENKKAPATKRPPDFITFLRHHIAHNDNQRVT